MCSAEAVNDTSTYFYIFIFQVLSIYLKSEHTDYMLRSDVGDNQDGWRMSWWGDGDVNIEWFQWKTHFRI